MKKQTKQTTYTTLEVSELLDMDQQEVSNCARLMGLKPTGNYRYELTGEEVKRMKRLLGK